MDTPESTPRPMRGTSQYIDQFLTDNARRLAWEVYEKRVAFILASQKNSYNRGDSQGGVHMYPPSQAEVETIGIGLAEALFHERHEILFEIGEALESEMVEGRREDVVATLAALIAVIRRRGPDQGRKNWGAPFDKAPHKWDDEAEKVIAALQREAADVRRMRLNMRFDEQTQKWTGDWEEENGPGRSTAGENPGEPTPQPADPTPAPKHEPATDPVGAGEPVAGGQRRRHSASSRSPRKAAGAPRKR